jgi:hypothetical protein
MQGIHIRTRPKKTNGREKSITNVRIRGIHLHTSGVIENLTALAFLRSSRFGRSDIDASEDLGCVLEI